MNLFQKYWSYFFRIRVEQVSSKHNPKLVVAIQDGKYVLNANNANYSFGSLHRVFQKTFNKLNLLDKNINSVLLLGAGAGSVSSIIYDELKLTPKIDAVEIDEEVVKLGKKYFHLEQYEKLTIHVEDAIHYVKDTKLIYDLIVVDLFEGINVPQKFCNEAFFLLLQRILRENGRLIFNFVAYNHETKERAKRIKKSLQHTFNNEVDVFKLERINVVYAVKK